MILVTGASGFVGSALIEHLANNGASAKLVASVRRSEFSFPKGVKSVQVGDLLSTTDWSEALQGVTVIVHCAARVHVMNDQSADPLAEFRRVNVEGTANLAYQAAVVGVRRFIFLSSTKVNGEFTEVDKPFVTDDAPAPQDFYGVSKLEAEQELRQIASDTGMEVVIIRPPLVYGPRVKANFESLMRWLSRGLPLPLAAVTRNRRSLVALDNLIDLITICLTHSAAANQTFLVSDSEDLSTVDLLRKMGRALGKPARLFYVPPCLLKLLAILLNKEGVYRRLFGSLQLDITKTGRLLGWVPPVSVDEGLRRASKGLRA